MADADLYQSLGITPQPAPDLYHALAIPQARQGQPNSTSWLGDALHDATGGLLDKATAAGEAMGMPGGTPGDSFGDRYSKNLTNIRNDFGDYETANPGWAGAKSAKAAGVVAPLAIVGPEKVAGDLASASLNSAKAGAVGGAAYGFGSTDDSSLTQDLEATGAGAVTGGVMGGAAPTAIGIAAAPFRMVGRGFKLFGKSGTDMAAGRVLNDAVGSSAVNLQPEPLPNMGLTVGQRSNNPGALWLEKSTGQGTPQGEQLLQDSIAKNNTAITTGISGLGNTAADAPTDMSTALDSIYAKRKAANAAAWKAADVSNTGGISGFQFNNFVQKYVNGLPIADQSVIPQNVLDVVGKIGAAKTQNLSDVQSVSSMVKGLASAASNSGDKNTARVLGGLADQVGQFVDMKANNLGAKYPLYKAALADTADMYKTFGTQPAAVKYFGTTSYGADKLPVSSTADNFIHAGKGAPEDLAAYLKMISSKDPTTGAVTYDPASVKAAQDAFAQKFLGTVTNTGVDANGNRLVSPAKMQGFMDDYGHVINSPLFSQPQRDLMGRIAQASKMASRTPPGTGSDTFPKLMGNKFIDTLIGPGASKIVNIGSTAAGALLGSAHGPVEAAAGLYGGGKVGDMISSLFNAPRDKVVSTVTAALHDPVLAQDLMTKASNANAKLIPPTRRAKIMGLLGAQAAAPASQALTAQ